jgi:hypothetical protein
MSNTATGMNESLSLGKEVSFKTMPATVNASKVPVTSPSIKPSRSEFQSQALTGSPQPNPLVTGKIGVDGSFTLECSKDALEPILDGVFGTPVKSGTTGFYERIYTLGTMLPMFVEQAHSDVSRYFLWNGIYFNSVSFIFGSEGLMSASVDVLGAKQTINEVTEIDGTHSDLTTAIPFSYLHSRISVAGAKVGWSQEVTLDINRNGYKELAQDETNEVAFIGFAKASVTGRVKALFQDVTSFHTAMTAAQNGTETSIEIYVPAGDGHGVWIVLPTIVFKPAAPVTSGTGVVTADLEFTAYARGPASSVPAGIRSAFFTSIDVATETLVISVDGAADQTVTFPEDTDTPAEVAAAINAQATGCTAVVERAAGETGGVVRIISNAVGSAGSIQVKASSTAEALLGFDTAAHLGLSGQSVVAYLVNARS